MHEIRMTVNSLIGSQGFTKPFSSVNRLLIPLKIFPPRKLVRLAKFCTRVFRGVTATIGIFQTGTGNLYLIYHEIKCPYFRPITNF